MASVTENTEESNTQIKALPADQCPPERHLGALDGKISDMHEQIELCTMILNDLQEVQRILAERGLENASLRELNN